MIFQVSDGLAGLAGLTGTMVIVDGMESFIVSTFSRSFPTATNDTCMIRIRKVLLLNSEN